MGESHKLTAEERKLAAEARHFDHDRWQMWQVVVTAMTVGTAFIKLLT